MDTKQLIAALETWADPIEFGRHLDMDKQEAKTVARAMLEAARRLIEMEDKIFDLENIELPSCAHEFWNDGFSAGQRSISLDPTHDIS